MRAHSTTTDASRKLVLMVAAVRSGYRAGGHRRKNHNTIRRGLQGKPPAKQKRRPQAPFPNDVVRQNCSAPSTCSPSSDSLITSSPSRTSR